MHKDKKKSYQETHVTVKTKLIKLIPFTLGGYGRGGQYQGVSGIFSGVKMLCKQHCNFCSPACHN